MVQNLPNVFEMGIGDRKIEKKNRFHSENKNVNDFVITLVVVRFFYLRKTEFEAFTFHLRHVSQCVYVVLLFFFPYHLYYGWFFCHRIESIFIFSRIHHKPQADSWLSCLHPNVIPKIIQDAMRRLKPFAYYAICIHFSCRACCVFSIQLCVAAKIVHHNQWRIHENYYYYCHLFIWNMEDSRFQYFPFFTSWYAIRREEANAKTKKKYGFFLHKRWRRQWRLQQ